MGDGLSLALVGGGGFVVLRHDLSGRGDAAGGVDSRERARRVSRLEYRLFGGGVEMDG